MPLDDPWVSWLGRENVLTDDDDDESDWLLVESSCTDGSILLDGSRLFV